MTPVAVIGHRGAPRRAPENTLAAFRAAAELGADAIELDVHVTLDGVAVVHHDDALAPGGTPLTELPAGALPGSIPTLAEALDLAAGAGLWVNVELKSDGRLPGRAMQGAALDAALAVLDGRDRRSLLISSFDPGCLERVRALDPTLRTARLAVVVREHTVDATVAAGHVALNPEHSGVDAGLVTTCGAAGLALYPWTVDDVASMRRLADWGVAGIITNVPDVLRGIVGSSDAG